MITKIKVDGFKSLSSFSIEFKAGLNILVGPNGSGKSNIVLFLQFLTNLMRLTAGDAVASSGGAGALFQKIGENKYCESINAVIYGNIERVSTPFMYLSKQRVNYKYEFSISMSSDRDYIYFSEEEISLLSYQRESRKELRSSSNKMWDLIVSRRINENMESIVKITKMDKRKIKPRFLSRFNTKSFEMSELERILSKQIMPDICILNQRILDAWQVMVVRSDIVGGEVININPNRVRRLEDGATPPGIRPDGSGLAATLYYLKQLREGRIGGKARYRWPAPIIGGARVRIRARRDTFAKIEQFLSLVNPEVCGIDVKNEPFDNRLDLKVSIKGERTETVLPFSVMSDGTVKWVALIAAILTTRPLLAIEEPENFLHPLMQREIVNIMRAEFGGRREGSFVLMTTHSETLLNAADPDEVVIVQMVGGATRSRRPKNKTALRSQINETGFGLGFYYITGALDDA